MSKNDYKNHRKFTSGQRSIPYEDTNKELTE